MIMEDKQLNFNRPLLSVRRGSSIANPPESDKRKYNNSLSSLPPLPYYKSELNSGPVRNAGAVPFQWEHTPGKPKDEGKSPKQPLNQPPRLPPGRTLNLKQKPLQKSLKNSPASWSLPEDDVSSLEISSVDKNVGELERSEDEIEEKRTSSSEDETYLDAVDTLSRSESFFLNCSVSGVSGLDGPDMKPSGSFSDPQTRDFMFGRFLPAAKAVASETPQFASRKPPVSKSQPDPVKKAIKWRKRSPPRYSVPDPLSQFDQSEGEEDEEDEDDYGGTEDLSAKICGLFPRFCLLNPIPGMRDQVTQARSVRTRPLQIKASNYRNEPKRISYQSAPTKFEKLYKCGYLDGNTLASYKKPSPHSFFHEERAFLGIPKEVRPVRASKIDSHQKGYTKLRGSLASHCLEEKSGEANPAVEKTLYIDSEQKTESRDSNSSSSESRGLTDSRGRNPSVDYSLHEIKSLCFPDEKVSVEPNSLDSVDHSAIPSLEKSKMDAEEVNVDVDGENLSKADVRGTVQKNHPLLPLSLPLPKSPSESWLSHALPSVTSRNVFSRAYFRASSPDVMQEANTKNSIVQNKQFEPSEKLAPILES